MKAFVVDLAAGIVGAAASTLVRRPLDVFDANLMKSRPAPKTAVDSNGDGRRDSNNNDHAKTSSKTFRRGAAAAGAIGAMRRQGFRGVYADVGPALAEECVKKAITFGAYGQCQKIVAGAVDRADPAGLSCLESAAAGSVSSIFTTMICRTENIRNTETNQIGQVKKNKWRIDGLHRYTILRENVRSTLVFGSYEWAREKFKPVGKEKEDCSPLATMTAGAFAGCVKSLVVHPMDVVKSRVHMSVKPGGLRLVREEIYQAGLRGLYKNFLSHLMKTVPTTAVMMFSVELSRPFIRRCQSKIETVSFDRPFNNSFAFRDFVSGWTAGIVSTFLGHPMGPVKVIKQAVNTMKAKPKTTLDKHSQDKSAGYFKGMVIPILSVGVAYSVFFGTYRYTLRLIQIYRDDGETKDDEDVKILCDLKNTLWHFDIFVSGCVAGFIYSVVNIPIEAVKTMIKQSSSILAVKSQPENVISPIKWIVYKYRKNGLRSLYQGGTLLMIRNVPYMGLFVLTCENLRCFIKKLWYAQNEETIIEYEPMPRIVKTISGGVAGVTIGLLVLPFDVIVARTLEDSISAKPMYKNVWDCMKQSYRKGGGSKEIFRGFGLLCLRNFIVCGVMFVFYDSLMDRCVESQISTGQENTY